jgi:hypothetical protein
MTQVVTGLPVIVEISTERRPIAFWWRNRRHAVTEQVCHWDDPCCISAHWLVRSEGGQRVTLIYDRAENRWFIDWASG